MTLSEACIGMAGKVDSVSAHGLSNKPLTESGAFSKTILEDKSALKYKTKPKLLPPSKQLNFRPAPLFIVLS
jgi:hypothetical protein